MFDLPGPANRRAAEAQGSRGGSASSPVPEALRLAVLDR